MTVVGVDVGPSWITKPTGVSKFVTETASRLRDHPGIELREFAVGRVRPGPAESHHYANRFLRHVPGSLIYRAWVKFERPRSRWWLGEDVEVVHGTNFFVPPSSGIPTLVTVHDVFGMRSVPEADTFPAREALLRQALDHGAHVHAVSNSTAAQVCDMFGVPPERVHVIALGGPAVQPSAVSTVDRSPTVVAFGAAIPRKNYLELIRAMPDVRRAEKDVRLIISAPGLHSTDYGEQMQREVRRLRLEGVVDLRDWVDDDEKQAMLQRARVLAYPSVMEGFGLPILEGMAAGCAVVVSGRGATAEVAGHEAALHCGVASDDIAASIIEALTDEQSARLSEAGSRRVQQFSWDATAAQLAALYKSLADGMR